MGAGNTVVGSLEKERQNHNSRLLPNIEMPQPASTNTAICMTSFHPSLAKLNLARDLASSPPTVYSNYSERLRLHARTVLVALEHYSSWPGELSWLAKGVDLKQFRTCLTYASLFSLFCPYFCQNANTMSLQ